MSDTGIREYVDERSVSLYPSDWAAVETLGERMGLKVSPTLRFIIRQWAEWRDIIAALPRLERSPTDERAVYVVEPFDGVHKEDTP